MSNTTEVAIDKLISDLELIEEKLQFIKEMMQLNCVYGQIETDLNIASITSSTIHQLMDDVKKEVHKDFWGDYSPPFFF